MLSHLRWHGAPIVRLIYGAVRDREWGTLLPQVSNLEVTEDADSFGVAFDAAYGAADIDLRCRCSFTGRADGTIDATFEGTAAQAFDYARIGLCVLLPWDRYCGRPYTAALHGVPAQGVIPEDIAGQYFVDGCYTPSIEPFTSFATTLGAGTTVTMAFEGDEFEMEDQRNWTDSTLKIYSTPLHLGNLHHAERGKRIHQVVRIAVNATGDASVPATPGGGVVGMRLGAPSGHAIPPLGTTWPRAAGMAAPPLASVEPLHLSHLRVELDLTRDERVSPDELTIPAGCAIELAIWTTEDRLAALPGIVAGVGESRIARIIVNDPAADVTPAPLIAAARRVLRQAGCNAPVGGGTDFWFAEINRSAHDFGALDFLSFTISPQLHVFDDESIWESLAIQEQVIEAAKRRVGSGRVVVSPINMIARDSNKVRERQAQAPDARHASALVAAWTAASIGHATAAGAEALTYFELFGPHGLLQVAAAPGPANVALTPAGLVLQRFGRAAGEPHYSVHSEAPEVLYAFGSGRLPGGTVTIVNGGPDPVEARLDGLAARPVAVRRLAQQDIQQGRWRSQSADESGTASADHRIALDGHEVVQVALGDPQT
jgi:hypothetical protein